MPRHLVEHRIALYYIHHDRAPVYDGTVLKENADNYSDAEYIKIPVTITVPY